MEDYLSQTTLDEVAITLNLDEYEKLEKLVAICEKSGVHTKFVPDYYNFISTNPYTEDLDGLPVINIRNVPLTNVVNRIAKRIIDIIGSACALVILAIPMLIIALLVKRSSPGPVFLRRKESGLATNRLRCTNSVPWVFRIQKRSHSVDKTKRPAGDPVRQVHPSHQSGRASSVL